MNKLHDISQTTSPLIAHLHETHDKNITFSPNKEL